MASIAEILEDVLEKAVQVTDKQFLHRYTTLLAENLLHRSEYTMENASIRSDIQVLAETIQAGFKRIDERFEASDRRFEGLTARMDERFEATNRRFEDANEHMKERFEASDRRFEDLTEHMNAGFGDSNRRFAMMFAFMTIGFAGLTLLMSLYKFIIP